MKGKSQTLRAKVLPSISSLPVSETLQNGSSIKTNFESNAKFKLDYYHTDGNSTQDRYWYKVMIRESLVTLNFRSPDNEDWNFVSYQKQKVLDEDELSKIKKVITESNLKEKTKGMPKLLGVGTGYGADRLCIAHESLNIAGGTVYMCIGNDNSHEDYEIRIKKEKENSTTISGDYQKVFDLLEALFEDLPDLLRSKNKKY